MAAGKHPGGGRPGQPAAKKSSAANGWVIALVTVVLVGGCIGIGVVNGDSGGTTVPAPAADERADTVPILAQAASSQGVCYGWRLESWYGSTPVSVGSNLGDGVPVVDDPACPRWVEVTADVRYTSESSESSDSATINVTGSPDIDRADLYAVETGLARFGLDSDVFVDDPGWAVCRAAVALPLLLAETGVVSPAAAPTAQPGATAAPLPDAGSDFWRDRWGWLLATGGLLLVTALLFTVGFVQRSRQRAAAPAGRTPGKA